MANPSNLYAEKIFSEHPLALWALDDQADYISLIDNTKRHLESWTITGATVTNNTTVVDEPFTSSPVTKIVGNVPTSQYGQVKLVSPDIKRFSDLDADIETFSIGTYVYAATDSITSTNSVVSYEIGYEYTDSVSGSIVENVTKYQVSVTDKWLLISDTFKNAKIGIDSSYFRIVIKINYFNIGSISGAYTFYANGISIGQLSEEFLATSLGNTTSPLPQPISSISSSLSAIPAKAYGLDEYQGYYLSDGKKLFAKNSGVPLVYGASNATIIYPNSNGQHPSLIVPSHGFLNNSGKYNDYTVEFWIKLENLSSDPRRIFGPILESSITESGNISGIYSDGIYVDGPFVKIKVGDNIGSHFIGDWSRPMLFDFKIGDGLAGLMVNGEQVISMPINLSGISFPDEQSISLNYGTQNQNWLGFYAYEDIPQIQIDCLAIYGYQASSILAKRRFAYGQAVEFPEGSNTAYGGTSVFIDYPFANYTSNYSYPELGNFNSGISDNSVISSTSLSTPKYSLPSVFFSDPTKTIDLWNQENEALSTTAGVNCVSFLEDNGYIFFDKLNILREDVKAIYGIFKAYEYPTTKKTLIKIQNRVTGDYLVSSIIDNKVVYEINIDDVTSTLYTEGDFVIGDMIFSGIDIDSITSFYGGDVASLFGNKNQLMVIIAGNQDFTNCFTGQIHKIGFSTKRNLKPIKKYFNSVFSGTQSYDAGSSYYGSLASFWNETVDGGDTAASFVASELYSHVASYTLIPKSNLGVLKLDIDVNSYWEDYVPLSFLSQYTTDDFGNKYYDLDFIQFNIGYPALPVYAGDTYDTNYSMVRSYITFKYDSSSVLNFEDHYKYSVPAQKNNVLQPGANKYIVGQDDSDNPIYDDFYNTKYEVVDGMIIYPPSGIDTSKLLMSLHLVINTTGTGDDQIQIKTIQFASEAFNGSTPNPIGTRFGNNIYPYRKYGSYYDYKGRVPYRIYKGSTPYLYLTRNSGIERVGPSNSYVTSGLEIPINENLSQEYKVIAMQMALRFNKESFPATPTEVFELESKESTIKFFVVANDFSGKRGRIYAVNSVTGQVENGMAFYLNGKIVREPVISLNEWSFIGIGFQKSMDLNGYSGAMRVSGEVLINIVSIYKSTNLQEIQKSLYRTWSSVRESTVIGPLDWVYWKTNAPYNWNGVLVVASLDYYGIDPSTVYKAYTGTNKIVIDDSRQIKINSYEYSIYSYGSTVAKIINAV